MLNWFTKNLPVRRTAQQLYGSIVARARNPVFYTRFAVPDSVAGRFDMIALHLFIVLAALKRFDGTEAEEATELSECLVETFFADLDDNLREMGIGDITVPKKMRKFADGFYGRISVYDGAMETEDEAALRGALMRNVYGGGPENCDSGVEEASAQLTTYVIDRYKTLAAWPLATIKTEGLGGPSFPPPVFLSN